LKLVWLSSDLADNFCDSINHFDVVRCARGKSKQAANKPSIVDALNRVTSMPGSFTISIKKDQPLPADYCR
jgi:hypothetical protein